ncbi:MAG TPA: oligosaccharide flippase family protein, partial [Candidatus Binatia bacterium]|nr:oligosaccharide flippase family protein [Candidatus Binatia bacterium]
MEHTRVFLRATGTLFFASLLAAGVGYLLKMVLARNLSVTEFGLFSAVFAFVSLFVGFSDLGMGTAAVKYIAQFNVEKKPQDTKNALLYLFIFQLAFLALVFPALALLTPFLSASYFKDPAAAGVLFVLLVAFSFSLFEAFFATAFHGFKRMAFFSTINILEPTLVLAGVLVLFPLGFHVLAPAYAYLFAFAFAPLLYLLMFRKTFPAFFQIPARWDPVLARQMFFAGMSNLVGGVGAVLLTSSGTLLLTYFRPLADVAIYSVAISVASIMRQIPKVLSLMLLPVSSELYTTKDPQLGSGIMRLYTYTFLVSIPLVFSMMFFARIIITILFGSTYALAELPLQILA